jgi:membrane associated rhomboid family serine protease
MIPLRDNIPYRTFPVVNYAVIAVCTAVFLLQLGDEPGDDVSLVTGYGMIPALVRHPEQSVIVREPYIDPEQKRVLVVEREIKPVITPWLTLLTCIFLHGGWMHFLGNMWFLHIFGDNVEDRLGHIGYVIFYLASGVLASLSHLVTNPDSAVPTIGASGAIAGVMGAYFVLYPRAQVESIVPVFGFIQLMTIPAPWFLGLWFLMQLFQGTAAITATATTGVAWWAHIGGFVVGMAVAGLLRTFGQTTPPVVQRLGHGDAVRISQYPR